MDYDPGLEKWEQLFGHGAHFKGTRFQRGAGLGTILSSALRLLLPIGEAVAKEGFHTATRALTGIAENKQPIADVLKTESKQAVRNLCKQVANSERKGGSIRVVKKCQNKKRLQQQPSVIVVRNSPKKRPRSDVFG